MEVYWSRTQRGGWNRTPQYRDSNGMEEGKRKAENRVSGLDEEDSKCTRWDGVGRDGTEHRWMETDEATMNRLRHEYAMTLEEEDVSLFYFIYCCFTKPYLEFS